MPFLREYSGNTLQWRRPHFFSSDYQLWVGDRLLASLNRTGLMKQSALAESEGQQWKFQREGLMGRKCVIYPVTPDAQAQDESTLALASIQLSWSGAGTLNFQNGRAYKWERTGGIWRPVWSWVGSSNKVLLSMKKGRSLEIAPAASDLPDTALLGVFGLYLVLMMEADEASSAAVVIGAAS
ncbi:MAG TPA: hypothetical protein VGD98_11025 [Ktedonobacteraceae bacterium]